MQKFELLAYNIISFISDILKSLDLEIHPN